MRISSLGTHWNSLWYCELYLLTVCAEGQGRVMSISLADRPACTAPPAQPATPPPPATLAPLAADTTLSLKGRELCTRLSTLAPYTHTHSRTSKAWSKPLQDTHCSPGAGQYWDEMEEDCLPLVYLHLQTHTRL